VKRIAEQQTRNREVGQKPPGPSVRAQFRGLDPEYLFV
jgi:hypothetical protein